MIEHLGMIDSGMEIFFLILFFVFIGCMAAVFSKEGGSGGGGGNGCSGSGGSSCGSSCGGGCGGGCGG